MKRNTSRGAYARGADRDSKLSNYRCHKADLRTLYRGGGYGLRANAPSPGCTAISTKEAATGKNAIKIYNDVEMIVGDLVNVCMYVQITGLHAMMLQGKEKEAV